MLMRNKILPKRQKGFTFLELTITLTVLSVLAYQLLPLFSQYVQSRAEEGTRRSLLLLSEGAISFYGSNSGAWPSNVAALSAELPGFRNFNHDGNDYQFIAIPGPSGGMQIRTTFASGGSAARVGRPWGGGAVFSGANGETLTITIPKPGYEVTHDHLVHRDGSRTMQGTLTFEPSANAGVANKNIDLQGNRIDNASRIQSRRPGGVGIVDADTVNGTLVTGDSFGYN